MVKPSHPYIFQQPSSDAIYNRDEEKKRSVGDYPAFFGLAAGVIEGRKRLGQQPSHVCDSLWGKDVTCATGVVLVFLPLLYKHFPHTYASEIRHVNRLSQ
jgi:hypothetical protein